MDDAEAKEELLLVLFGVVVDEAGHLDFLAQELVGVIVEGFHKFHVVLGRYLDGVFFRIIPVVSDPRYTKGIEEYKKKNRHGKVAIFPFCEPQYNVKAL